MTKLSVIILTWNSEKHIAPCLDSLINAIDRLDYEIILVDNGSTDGSLKLLENYLSSNIHLIKNKKNVGVAKARNQAIQIAKGDFILILDVDTEVHERTIETLIQCIESDEKIGLCACKLVSPTGEVQQSCRKFPTLRYKIKNVLASKNINVEANKLQFYEQEMQGDKPFEVDYVIGACQLIRKKAMDEVGLLDEKIFYGPEDADLCLRMKQKGWKIIYVPTVTILHHYQQLSNKKLFSAMSYKHTKALIYYFWKHKKN